MPRRFLSLGLKKGDRLALVAETGPEFAACFFGAVYAGLWPVPLPLPTSFGGREAYVDQLVVMLTSSDPQLFLYPPELAEFATAAANRRGVAARDWDSLADVEPAADELSAPGSDEIAYLQYSSGSTRFPHGVAVTHRALLDNLRAHGLGLHVEETDRCISWLPWYHDMGLVGCMLSPMANQLSVDYLKTEDFARRPLAWLDLISRHPGTTLSYSPTFGYDICSRRMSSQTRAADRFDLSRWRIAGNGADMIRPDVMQAFVDSFADAGFKASAFCPSYGLAEATLAVSLMPPGEGIRLELVEESELSGVGTPAQERPRRYRAIVNCGKPVEGMEIEIRGADGEPLAERSIGKVWVRGSSVMVGYFRDPEVDGGLHAGRLARHRRHGLHVGRLHLHRRPRQGHDHHQRPKPLAAGYRMGGRAIARFQVGRYRRLRHHRPQRRGNARCFGPLPCQRPARARSSPRRHPRTGPRDHRNFPGGRTDPPAQPAPHLFGQAVAHQGAELVSVG